MVNGFDRKHIYIAAGAVILIIVALVFFFVSRSDKVNDQVVDETEHRGIAGDATDITLDFYSAWLARRKTTTVSSTTNNPLESMALSVAMQQKLADFDFSMKETELDPVLCQTALPNGLRTNSIFSKEDTEQILVLSRDREAGGQAAVTLEKYNGLWEITNITCSAGEEAPEIGEFSFDNEGFLLKDSLPEPFDSNYWHLVFQQDGTPGHTAALLIDEKTVCVDADKNEGPCNTSAFTETMYKHVLGQMTEAGVEVQRIETPR